MEIVSAHYRDPRWKAKAKRVRKRDKNRCKHCGRRGWQVHHIEYIGDFIWETPDEYLETTCDTCHRGEHQKLNVFDTPVLILRLVLSWALVVILFLVFVLPFIVEQIPTVEKYVSILKKFFSK